MTREKSTAESYFPLITLALQPPKSPKCSPAVDGKGILIYSPKSSWIWQGILIEQWGEIFIFNRAEALLSEGNNEEFFDVLDRTIDTQHAAFVSFVMHVTNFRVEKKLESWWNFKFQFLSISGNILTTKLIGIFPATAHGGSDTVLEYEVLGQELLESRVGSWSDVDLTWRGLGKFGNTKGRILERRSF